MKTKTIPVRNRIKEIKELHEEVCSRIRTAAEKAIRLGELLTAQKGECAHGEWIPWIEANAPFDRKTAARYMACFQNRERLNVSSARHLTIEDLARISEPEPEPLQATVIRLEPKPEPRIIDVVVIPEPEPPIAAVYGGSNGEPKPDSEKTVDPVDAAITRLWFKRPSRTSLREFREFVSGAIRIPGSVSVVDAALDKFNP